MSVSEMEAQTLTLPDGWADRAVPSREPRCLTLRGSPLVQQENSVEESTVSPFRDVPLS